MRVLNISRFTVILTASWATGLAGSLTDHAVLEAPLVAVVGWMVWRAWRTGI